MAQMAPWTANDVHGLPVTSQSLGNRVMLVDFWETTCSTCVEELPDLVRLNRTLAPKGFSMVGLSVDLNPQWVVDYLGVHTNITYPMMMSSKSATSSLLGGPLGMPTKYLVDQDRKILARYSGGHDPVSDTYAFYSSQVEPLLREPYSPTLQIQRQQGIWTLSWPDLDPRYRLETSSRPSAVAWEEIAGNVQNNDGRFTVTLPASDSEAGQFFRLKRP
jgi:thiol-disulfide isomerase/thioredoxin